VFSDGDLPMIFNFYCVKIGPRCPSVGDIIANDDDADRFIKTALQFIAKVQVDSVSIYQQTVREDSKPIGDIPLLNEGPDGRAGGIAQICTDLFGKNAALVTPYLGPNETLPTAITSASPRKLLRLCNYIIVFLKINGDPNEVVSGDAQAPVQLESKVLDSLKHRLGAKHYVDWKLQVRALNLGARPVAVNLGLYEGDGTDPNHYRGLKSVPVALDAGEMQLVAKEADPDHPGEKRPLFPLLFNLSRPELAPGQARALTFFLDPERTIPEANKRDNQASFFYYVLDTNGGSPPATPDTPIAPIPNVDPDPLAIPEPRLAFDFTVRARSGGIGAKQISAGLDEDVVLTYAIRNLGPVKVTNVEVVRDHQTVVTVSELAAAGDHGDHVLLTDPTFFTPADAKTYLLQAYAMGFDPKGNRVGPVSDIVSVTGNEDLSQLKVRLFDASALADLHHPFSRFLANQDDAGHDLPLIGAVTDGDENGGGARIRVEVDRLTPGAPVTITLKDPDIPDATDGLGWLEFGDQIALQSVTATPGLDRLVLYYRPPAVFVRDGHRVEDSAKQERTVKLSLVQPGGGGVKRILLRRPPVLLVHGLFSNTRTWNDLQPLVPPGGLTPGYTPTKGFDGRFDLMAAGSTTMHGTIAEEAAALKSQIKSWLGLQFPRMAIGRMDVVAHSMGSLVVRQIINDFVSSQEAWGGVVKLPFRKLIAIDTPFSGTPLADRIVDLRDQLPVKVDVNFPKDLLDLETSVGGTSGAPEITPEIKVKAKIESCAFMIKSIGLTPFVFLHGAMDDLVAGSDAVNRIANAGISVPSHHIVGTTASSGLTTPLAVSVDMNVLWGTLGYFCNLTPDSTTTEATILAQVGGEALTLLISGALGDLKPPTGIQQGLAEIPLGTVSKETAMFLKRVGPVAKFARKEETSAPMPVFIAGNDRAVGAGGQFGGIPLGSLALTTIDGPIDHVSVLRTPGVPISACGDLSSTSVPLPHDLNLDGTLDVTCRLIYLLEAAPSSPLFFRDVRP
jgi:pimeloyl-ACP methyl ester carboxylesterase